MYEFGNKIAIFGGIFLGLGLVLLFVLFFWLLKRARIIEEEKERRNYKRFFRIIIFILSILLIFSAWLFFQMQNQLRPFYVLSSEKLIAEIKAEKLKDSYLALSFLTQGRKGKVYQEEFELLSENLISPEIKLKLEAEILLWENWLNVFGFVDGYKLTSLEVFSSSDTPGEKIKAFKLSGGPTEIWKKIYDWRKLLLMVKPEKLESDFFILNPGETKKVYIKDKKIVVE